MAPVVVLVGIMKGKRRGADLGLPLPVLAVVLVIALVVGAFLGAALSLKDVVTGRRERGEKVAFSLRLLFGSGILSVVVWFVAGIIGTLVVTMVGIEMKLL